VVAGALLIAVAFGPWASAQSAATGDVDCDGGLSITDAQLLAQFVIGGVSDQGGCPVPEPGSRINAAAGDLNGDGTAGTIDVLFMVQCALGFPAVVDCPSP